MSGRKSSEVAGVLRQGEAVRRMTDGIYSNQIERDFNEYCKILAGIRAIQNQIKNSKPNLSSEAQSLFANEISAQGREYDSLQASLSKLAENDGDGENILQQLKNLDHQLEEADAEAADIRRAIRMKDWYCDEEYNRAQALVLDYKNLRDRRVDLQHRMTQAAQAARQNLNQAQALANRLKNLQASIEQMNELARKRQESDTMRRELQQALKNIPADWAEKFFAADYANLKAAVNKAAAENDDAVIRTFKNVYADVTAFKTKLDARLETWKNEKADAESWLGKVEALADFELAEPIDYYNNGENCAKTELFAYIGKYGAKDFQTTYRQNLRDAQAAIKNEDFIKGVELLKQAAAVVTEARDYASNLQENMLKKTELAGAIQNVMADLRYNVDLSILNDNPNDGYKITCSIGDEIIDFDRVDIDDEGRVIVDVNHKEAIGGTCGSSWQSIAKKMQDAGIPVTDVKLAGGGSVLRKAQAAKGTGSGATAVGVH